MIRAGGGLRFLEERSANGVLGLVNGSFQGKVSRGVHDLRKGRLEIKAGIRQDYVDSLAT